jgi:outer membrane receptor protein involved in Fe transport
VPLSRANNKYDFILSGSINKKFNPRNFTKVGFVIDRIGFRWLIAFIVLKLPPMKQHKSDGNATLPGLCRMAHRFSDELELNTGLHLQVLALNDAFSVEPRASFRWTFRPGQSFNVGYGLHSITQKPDVYFRRLETAGGTYEEVNRNLGFTRAHHFIAGYDLNFARNFRMKSEVYYQYLFDVPVETRPSNFSTLNNSSMQYFSYDTLINNGTGRNYGVEITLEKFLSRGYYFLLTGSIFDSKYKGSDGVLRSTAFDSRYVTNLLGGKEFRLNAGNQEAKLKTWLVVDGKLTAAGGIRYTPIDLQRSKEAGHAIYNEQLAFSKQFDDYFRLDLRVAFRIDAKKVSHEIAFDVQNITNHQNPIYMTYNADTGKEEFINQLGIFPMA